MSRETVSFLRKFDMIARNVNVTLCRNRSEFFSAMWYLKGTIKAQAAMQS